MTQSRHIVSGYSDLREAWLLRFEGGHVDGEAVLHVGLEQSLVGLIDLLDGDDFDIGGDVVLTAKVQHLLGFRDAANGRSGKAAPSKEKAKGSDGERLLWRADERDGAVPGQKVEVGINVVVRRDRIEDKVEAAGVLLHLVGIAGDDDFVRS